jgi:type II secretory pathway pseudopilin PulG
MLNKISKLNNIGFTLVETLIAMAIFTFIAVLIAESFANTIFYTSNLSSEIKIENQVQSSLEYIKREMRLSAYTTFNDQGTVTPPNTCDYLGQQLYYGNSPICNSPSSGGSFNLYNASDQLIGSITLQSGILDFTNSSISGSPISIQLNSNGVNIENISFFYDNYDFSGTSYSGKSYIFPYINIFIEGCQKSYYNYLFNSSSNTTPACVQLITTATNENFVYH